MWEWINSMTGWQWLAIAAFILSSISVTNAFLGLRERYRRQRAIKSQQGFDRQIKAGETMFHKINQFKNSPQYFFIEIVEATMSQAQRLISALFLFSVAFFFISVPLTDEKWYKIIPLFLIMFAQVILNLVVRNVYSIRNFAKRIRLPMIVAFDYINLIKKGRENDFISLEDAQNKIDMMLQNTFFDDSEKETLLKNVDKSLIKP